MAAKRKQRQTPRLDEDARDELGRGVLRGSVSRLESEPGLGDRIIERLNRGQSHATASEAEGVPRRTYFDWLERGRSDRDAGVQSLWADFAAGVDRTVAEVLGRVEAGIVDAEPLADSGGKIDPAVARNRQWYLERRLPDVYGRRIEHSVRVDAMEWVIAKLQEGVDAGRISPSARAEVLLYFADMSPTDDTAAAVH